MLKTTPPQVPPTKVSIHLGVTLIVFQMQYINWICYSEYTELTQRERWDEKYFILLFYYGKFTKETKNIIIWNLKCIQRHNCNSFPNVVMSLNTVFIY